MKQEKHSMESRMREIRTLHLRKCYGGTSRFDEGEVASCTAEASLRRVHCQRQPEERASVCAAKPRRESLLYHKSTMTAAIRMVVLGILAAGGALAKPTVTDVSISQMPTSRRVVINYRLTGEKAIITLDIQTNGVSIGSSKFANAAGDVNKEIAPSSEQLRTITWQPKDTWPNRLVEGASLRAVIKAHTFDDPPNFMVVDLLQADTIRYYDSAEQVPGGISNDLYKTEKLLFSKIPAAGVEWRMGSPAEGVLAEVGRGTDEVPHLVTLSSDYYMAVYELTYRHHYLITGSSYANVSGKERKPYSTTYNGYRGSNWPSGGHTNVTGLVKTLRGRACGFMFDLPTEAQWEFACRGGSGAAFCDGGNLESASETTNEHADRYAVYKGNSSGGADVGTKEPNVWGLYDMHGNFAEWCLDWYVADLSTLPSSDPVGADSGSNRIMRGGTHSAKPSNIRSAYRNSRAPTADYGNVCGRLCCPIPMDAID